jgi:very-short-patch-repair endonuclease
MLGHKKKPTEHEKLLKQELEKRGVKVFPQFNDSHKHIDLYLPEAKINIEIDGIQHLTDARHILSDFGRTYYADKAGYNTIHIQNEVLDKHLEEIADAIVEVVAIRKNQSNNS